MLADSERAKGVLRRGIQAEPRDNIPTLADIGIDKKLSSRAQKIAADERLSNAAHVQHLPPNGGTLFAGLAVSTRGRRYEFTASMKGELGSVFREDRRFTLVGGRTFWSLATPHPSLRAMVRKAVRKAKLS